MVKGLITFLGGKLFLQFQPKPLNGFHQDLFVPGANIAHGIKAQKEANEQGFISSSKKKWQVAMLKFSEWIQSLLLNIYRTFSTGLQKFNCQLPKRHQCGRWGLIFLIPSSTLLSPLIILFFDKETLCWNKKCIELIVILKHNELDTLCLQFSSMLITSCCDWLSSTQLRRRIWP